MEIFKVIGVAIISVILIIVLKSNKRDDISLFLIIISSVILLSYMFLKLESIIKLLDEFVANAGVNKSYLTILLKVTGISYIVELASNICKDAGISSISSKLEMIGKVSIVVLTMPILTSIIEVILNISKGNI